MILKIVIVAGAGTVFEKSRGIFQKALEQRAGGEIVWLCCDGKRSGNIMTELQKLAPDLLVTVDLLGFEQCTLTDNISYNLLNGKQIHLLLHEELPNEKYLEKQLSIAMFFYCAGDVYYDFLRKKYPDLPYLKEIPDWQTGEDERAAEKNAEILSGILREVSEECKIADYLPSTSAQSFPRMSE